VPPPVCSGVAAKDSDEPCDHASKSSPYRVLTSLTTKSRRTAIDPTAVLSFLVCNTSRTTRASSGETRKLTKSNFSDKQNQAYVVVTGVSSEKARKWERWIG